jgi:hypothetical protein
MMMVMIVTRTGLSKDRGRTVVLRSTPCMVCSPLAEQWPFVDVENLDHV